MASVMFKKGLLANLPSTMSEGTFYVTTDERAIYLDVSADSRIRLGDFQEFATLADLQANTNPSTTALYYVADLNVLAKWNGSGYTQINLDTGATSFEVVGDGNVITDVSYDAATRKLTLTKGITAATAAYVGTIPEGYSESNIVAYINKKAEETLNAASGGSSESAASVLAALNTYKSETEPRISALEGDTHTHSNKDVIDGITAEKVSAWDAAEGNAKAYAKEYADGLAGNYDVAGAAKAVQDKLDEEVLRAKAAEEANAAAAKAADDKAVAAQGEIDSLEAKVGEVPADKTVVQMISEAQSAATYDDTQVKADIEANKEAIELLNDGAEVEGSVDYKIAQAVAAIMENPDETMNSINELVTWINNHAEDALELSNKVSANEGDIAALEALVGETGVAQQISDAITAALKIEGVDKYALASDLTAAIGRIAAMEAKVASWDAAEQNAKDYADGLNTAMDTRMQAVEGKAHEHTNKEELDKIVAGDKAKWDAAQANAEATAAAALASAKSELEGKITAETERATAAEGKALSDAKAYADGLAGNYDVSGAADAALESAKSYTDEQLTAALTWGSF